jgi:hypothetical protein
MNTQDIFRDAVALVEAKRRRDDAAVKVLLDHGDPREIAELLAYILSRVAADDRTGRMARLFQAFREYTP